MLAGKTEDGIAKPAALYSASGMAKLVQRLRQVAKPSQTFSLDACRHGGMTEPRNAFQIERGEQNGTDNSLYRSIA